jgi:hypothetical protein
MTGACNACAQLALARDPRDNRCMSRRAGIVFIVTSIVAACRCSGSAGPPSDAPCATPEEIASLRLNQVQIVGSHNSYRRLTYKPIFDLIQSFGATAPEEINASSWDYDHLPLAEQMTDYGMRALELDVFNDPAGGRFYERQGLRFVNEPTASNLPELLEPGMKVLHVPDFDYETHHLTFVSALRAIATWSDTHPRHLPLFIQIESKESTVAEVLTNQGLTEAAPFDAAAADALDAEISSVFAPTRIITPDEVRGTHATLDEAVTTQGWPLLEACRGRVLFFMEGPAVDDYLAGAPGLAGRLIFVQSAPGDAHAAVVFGNNPVDGMATITDLARRGYIVRTMADSSTVEARSGDRTRMNAALASGAHIVSTDYYRPDPRGAMAGSGWSNYAVALPGGGPARSNPVSAAGAGMSQLRICE